MARDDDGRRLRRTWPQRLLIVFNLSVVLSTLVLAETNPSLRSTFEQAGAKDASVADES